MMIRKSSLISLPAILLTASLLQADPIAVTLVNAGPVNDGVDYVLPYELSIDGLFVYADCYDFFDWVQSGETWQANPLTLSEAASFGQFSGVTHSLERYEEVAWLSSQLAATPQNQIDLQHAMWNVFDPGQFPVSAGMQVYLDRLAAAQLYFDVSDFANYTFLEGVPGSGPLPQAFVIYSGQPSQEGAAPEPDTIVLVAAGLGLIAVSRILWRRMR